MKTWVAINATLVVFGFFVELYQREFRKMAFPYGMALVAVALVSTVVSLLVMLWVWALSP